MSNGDNARFDIKFFLLIILVVLNVNRDWTIDNKKQLSVKCAIQRARETSAEIHSDIGVRFLTVLER